MQLIRAKEWRTLRARKLAANPLCEEHLKRGKYVAASVVHHIVEVESGHSEAECRRLAYSWSNLESLCRECHAAIHKAAHSHSREAHRKREADRLEQWKSRWERKDAGALRLHTQRETDRQTGQT